MPASLLSTEIHEQPAAVQRLLDMQSAPVLRAAASLRERFDSMLIAARGTSDNAARYAQYLFGAYNQLPVALATPSLFTLYQRPPRLSRMLVVGISQSGQSPDIVAVVAEGRRQGQPTLAITNDPESPLARAAEVVIALSAGPEKAVAATKTYTTSLAAMVLFSAALADDSSRLAELRRIPGLIQQTLEMTAAVMGRVERYRYMDRLAVLGRGFNYATAFEVALKVKELTSVVAEPYSSADFRHGPIAIVKNGFPVLVIAPSGEVNADMVTLVDELKKRDAEILLISDQPQLLKQADTPLAIPAGLPEWATPLLAVLPGQCFAMQLAMTKRLNPDQPIGLTKVTETY